jgi:tripartite-type tricarboxylate transporter receptor subunit TctC
MQRRSFIQTGIQSSIALAAPAMASMALGQTAAFPSKGLRIVVPYPAGGATDATARLIAEKLSKVLGQNVIVDNKTGASGAIGCAEVAKSPADGHTLLYSLNDPLVNNTVLIKNLPYDPQKRFSICSIYFAQPRTFVSACQLRCQKF